MERFAVQTVAAPLTPSGSDDVDLIVPSSVSRWSVQVRPIHTGMGTPDDSTLVVQYFVGGDWAPVASLSTPVAALTNKVSVVTREDCVGRLRVTLAHGATPPDGGIVVELWGQRSN